MDFEEIRNLVKLMSEHNLTEVKIESDSCNICFKRGGDHAAAVVPAVQLSAASAPVAAPAAPSEPAAAKPTVSVDSPLVGTFYRSASPDAAPFVRVGDRIGADTVIGIIEAMKVMNEIKAEKSGVIKEILIENGQPVEFGQPIIVLE